ncbi:Dynamin family-domain-containing protein [Amylocystis lapponica]|nr:Dynamin family-domain-containing protein [Amylocystis lapponica]
MSSKENTGIPGSSKSMPFIKPEPQEQRLAPLTASASQQRLYADVKSASTVVKPEPRDTTRLPAKQEAPPSQDVPGAASQTSQDAPRILYTVHKSADEIEYLPEDALKEGLGMVRMIKQNIKKLELGSKLRKEVWLREIESLQSQGAPTTMIAVCGATGAGKSSILNAILDDNIVPTSGMRACTAVVTEIGYHAKKTIDGDVSFLSEQEWREELAVLLDDLVDEDGNVKRSTDLRSDAGVAWSKVHAVYPSVSQEQLVRLTVDQIISRDQRIKNILGTTKHITANDSKTFGKEIGKYIDSKDQKRGDKKDKKGKEKKDKEKEKEKPKENILSKFLKDNSGKKKDKDDVDGPAYWPLIRQVNVRCNAAALSTGAVLVDLPGVADANAARNNIAKDYMKKCDCIWILAPITRAVDDKTARDLMGDAFKMQLMMDGNYDANAITFIATKCDDISCSEVIRALNLDDDSTLEGIEEHILECKNETDEWKDKKSEAEDSARETDKQLKQIREYLAEYQEHLKALETGEEFVPRLTGKSKSKKSEESVSAGKKRKNTRGGKQGSSKKRKSEINDNDHMSVDDDDDDIDDDLEFSDDDSDKQSVPEDEKDSSDNDSDSESDSGSESDSDNENNDDDEEEEEVTAESLKVKIDETKEAIKAARVQLSDFRKQRKEASDMLASLKKKELKAQREKNAFCSLKRSEFSRDVLKEDFRVGLKDLDDAAAEERDPDAFDPTVNVRNYEEIDLPVFTCSARDYVRLKGQVKGDGDPTCFSNVEDTGIPEMQKWCHQLTVSSRERAARNFLAHLKTFTNSVRTYVEGIGDVTETDRESLREKWESMMPDDDDLEGLAYGDGWASSDPFDLPLLDALASGNPLAGGLYSLQKKETKLDKYGEPVGVTPRLTRDFRTVIDNCVNDLQACFQDGLEEKCQTGAENASSAALQTSDTFAASMHWGTYRATLRRHGSWRQDLNVELTNPFTRNIASSWSKVFETDLFASFEKAATATINKLLAEVEQSAAPGLKERAKGQAELCLEEANVALRKTLDVVRDAMNTEQKEISRCLAPHVQNQLVDGYDRAMEERGKGSVARQKAVFHDYVEDIKDEVFQGAVDVLMGRLSKAAEAIGKALEESLSELAEKIEVSIAVLWEGPRDDPSQVKARTEVIVSMSEITEQIHLWMQAEQLKRLASA